VKDREDFHETRQILVKFMTPGVYSIRGYGLSPAWLKRSQVVNEFQSFHGIDPPPAACPRCGKKSEIGCEPSPEGCPNCRGVLLAADSPEADFAQEQLIRDLREALNSSDPIFGVTPSGLAGPPRIEELEDDLPLTNEPLFDRCIGEFQIADELGRGGMGIVYRAWQPSLDREVAIKILPRAALKIGTSSPGSPARRRFRTEARAIARLNHPNVVPVYAQGEFDEHYYYAMALIDGCSLDVAIHEKPELLSSTAVRRMTPKETAETNAPLPESPKGKDTMPVHKGGRPPNRTAEDFRHLARLISEVADGLAHAHGHGVIHRDIKPQNLLLSEDGRIYITDFGLSMLTDEPHLTVTGELMGTPAYLSPEQIRGDPKVIDHRTDIYSLGVTLYELITGRRPFVGDTRDELISRICSVEPNPPRRIDRHIPLDLDTICLRALEKDPAHRFPTAALLAEDLKRFADDRPIVSRRPGRVRRGIRFLSRRRAAAVGFVSLIGSLVVAGGYFTNLIVSREEEADRLLQAAYEQLVYSDYRAPELVQEPLHRAEALGAEAGRLNLVRAIADLGASKNTDGVKRLQAVLGDSPDHIAALYLLSWAQRRTNNPRAARETFARAESFGGPRQPDEWFFRGLATHFDDPAGAIDSYEKANSLRAAQHRFFPQAVLHLARAYNQRMYAERTKDGFDDAQTILLQLIKRRHYRSYPYYLLSITQRLYGEILEVESDPNDSARSDELFRTALDWARLGQKVDPQDENPVYAEAESLEQLGRINEAIEARGRAIAIAKQEKNRWEGYHYRWRLHYWLNDGNAALEDLEICKGFDPKSLFYSRVYPIWVYANMGDMPRAVDEARAMPRDAPNEAQSVLWSAACLRLLGRGDEAGELLARSRDNVSFSAGLVSPQTEEWVAALFDCSSGQNEIDELLALADSVVEPGKLRAEAHFHVALKALGDGRRDEAVRRLTDAYRCFDNEMRYTFHAKTLLKKLERDLGWPSWLSGPDKVHAKVLNKTNDPD